MSAPTLRADLVDGARSLLRAGSGVGDCGKEKPPTVDSARSRCLSAAPTAAGIRFASGRQCLAQHRPGNHLSVRVRSSGPMAC